MRGARCRDGALATATGRSVPQPLATLLPSPLQRGMRTCTRDLSDGGGDAEALALVPRAGASVAAEEAAEEEAADGGGRSQPGHVSQALKGGRSMGCRVIFVPQRPTREVGRGATASRAAGRVWSQSPGKRRGGWRASAP